MSALSESACEVLNAMESENTTDKGVTGEENDAGVEIQSCEQPVDTDEKSVSSGAEDAEGEKVEDSNESQMAPMAAKKWDKVHPCKELLDKYKPSAEDMAKPPEFKVPDIDEVPRVYVDTQAALEELSQQLMGEKEIGVAIKYNLDSYETRLCFLLISTKASNYLIDCLALGQSVHLLDSVFTSPTVVKVIFALKVVRNLQVDCNMWFVNTFNLQVAFRQFHTSESYLHYLEKEYNLKLDHTLNMCDWQSRPLSEIYQRHAAMFTHYLIPIYYKLKEKLIDLGTIESVLETCNKESGFIFNPKSTLEEMFPDLEMRPANQVAILCDLDALRHRIGKQNNLNVNVVLPNKRMLRLAFKMPTEVEEILVMAANNEHVEKHVKEVQEIIMKWKDAIGPHNFWQYKPKKNKKKVGGKSPVDKDIVGGDKEIKPKKPDLVGGDKKIKSKKPLKNMPKKNTLVKPGMTKPVLKHSYNLDRKRDIFRNKTKLFNNVAGNQFRNQDNNFFRNRFNDRFGNPHGHYGNPDGRFRNPHNHFGNPNDRFRNPDGRFRNPHNLFGNPNNRFRNPDEQFRNPDVRFESPYDRFENSDDHFRNSDDRFENPTRFRNPDDHFGNPDDRFRNPDDRFRNPDDHFESPPDRFGNPDDRFRNPDDHFESPPDRFGNPDDRFRNPDDRFESPYDRFENPDAHLGNNFNRFGNPGDRLMNATNERFRNPDDRFRNPNDRFESPHDRFDNPDPHFGNNFNRFGNPDDRFRNPNDRSEAPHDRFENPDVCFGNNSNRFGNPGDRFETPHDRIGNPDNGYGRHDDRNSRPLDHLDPLNRRLDGHFRDRDDEPSGKRQKTMACNIYEPRDPFPVKGPNLLTTDLDIQRRNGDSRQIDRWERPAQRDNPPNSTNTFTKLGSRFMNSNSRNPLETNMPHRRPEMLSSTQSRFERGIQREGIFPAAAQSMGMNYVPMLSDRAPIRNFDRQSANGPRKPDMVSYPNQSNMVSYPKYNPSRYNRQGF